MDFAPAWRKYAYNPYKYKDELILQAISLIRKNGRKSGFSYFLTNEFRDSYIAYFSFRIGGSKASSKLSYSWLFYNQRAKKLTQKI